MRRACMLPAFSLLNLAMCWSEACSLMPKNGKCRSSGSGFTTRAAAVGGEVDHWLSTHTKSGSYQFSNVSRAWTKKSMLRGLKRFRKRSGRRHLSAESHFQSPFQAFGIAADVLPAISGNGSGWVRGIVDTGEVTVLTASPSFCGDERAVDRNTADEGGRRLAEYAPG